MRGSHRQHRRVHHAALVEERHVGRSATDVDERNTKVELVVVEHGLSRGQYLHHQVFDAHARLVYALDHVLHRGQRTGDDVRLDLEPGARHADGVLDALLSVDHVAAGDDMDDLAVVGHGNRTRRVDDAGDVFLSDLAVLTRDRYHTATVLAQHMRARHADEARLQLVTAHALRGIDGMRDT